jgi:hypothetical protein
MKMVNCCGFRVSEWVYAVIAEADLSVRAASAVCRLCRDFPCNTREELLFNLGELVAGRLLVLGCTKRVIAEITEKIIQ